MPGALSLEQCMVQNNGLWAIGCRHAPDFDVELLAAIRHRQCINQARSLQLMQESIGWCRDMNAPALPGQRQRQVTHYVAHAADLATGQGTVLRREEYDLTGTDGMNLARVVKLLPEHVGRHQRMSCFGDTKAACAIVIRVFANNRSVFNFCAGIDDAVIDATVFADLDAWQQH
jgi:hypothetical protein